MAKSKEKQPTILITNDDGVTAPGISALIEVAKNYGRVVVVAPDAPQSGMGHAITIGKPLRLNKVNLFSGVEAYQCTGTPVDCVKLANDIVLKGQKADLCLSGINHGSNASINVIYSGTMSAAMEASIEGIPSVGFSLLNYAFDADFSGAKEIAHLVIQFMLDHQWTDHTLFNVNIPDVPFSKIKGIRVCRQAHAKWQENFVERKDPMGKKYYWLTGEFKNLDKAKDTDIWALEHNYASMVPVHYDLTDYDMQLQLSEYLSKKADK
ncbi:MAG: 5/3-nucleotidase SurE [Bacteroidota bacterium]|jgi:5'-nucleotidase